MEYECHTPIVVFGWVNSGSGRESKKRTPRVGFDLFLRFELVGAEYLF